MRAQYNQRPRFKADRTTIDLAIQSAAKDFADAKRIINDDPDTANDLLLTSIAQTNLAIATMLLAQIED